MNPRVVLIVIVGMTMLASCTTGQKPLSSTQSVNKVVSFNLVATYPAKYGNTFYLFDGECGYSSSAKKFPYNYVLKSSAGSIIQRGCYYLDNKTKIAYLEDQDGTIIDLSKPKPNSVNPTPQNQQANKPEAKKSVAKSESVIIDTTSILVTSDPPSAKVLVESEKVLGVTPIELSFKHRADAADKDGCFKMPKFKVVWASGAEFVSNEKHKLCPSNGKFSLNIKRPKIAGLQVDLDYAHKQDILKIQQEQLKLQQQQAEQQRNYMEQQAVAQRRQAAALEKQAQIADDELTYQQFNFYKKMFDPDPPANLRDRYPLLYE